MKSVTIGLCGAAIAGALALGGCEPAKPVPPPAPPAAPSPPSPDLPMTPAKAREIVGDLPLACTELASLKMDLVTCDERQGKATDHAALRTELRDLRWNLQSLPREQAASQCTATVTELRNTPKPQVCWDLGMT